MNEGFYNFGTGFHDNNLFQMKIRHKKNIRRHAIRVGICILVFLSAPLVFGTVLGLTGFYEQYSESFALQYCTEMFLMVTCLFVPFFAVYISSDKKNRQAITASLEKPEASLLFLVSIPFGLMLCFAGDYISSVISTLFEQIGITLTNTPDYEVPTSGSNLFLYAFATIVPPAIIEEFALRSVTMQPLRRYGDKFAILMTALVFGLMHRNAVQGIFAFIAGVVFGYIAIAANSVWPAIIVHALNNSFAVLVNVLLQTNEETANRVYALVVSIVMVTGIISGAVFFFVADRNKLKKPVAYLTLKEKSSSFFLNVPMIISLAVMVFYTIFGDL